MITSMDPNVQRSNRTANERWATADTDVTWTADKQDYSWGMVTAFWTKPRSTLCLLIFYTSVSSIQTNYNHPPPQRSVGFNVGILQSSPPTPDSLSLIVGHRIASQRPSRTLRRGRQGGGEVCLPGLRISCFSYSKLKALYKKKGEANTIWGIYCFFLLCVCCQWDMGCWVSWWRWF
jgi:hypothetical protein